MAEQETQQERRPWNALDEWKLRLEATEKPQGATRKPTLKIAMIANQLRFQVFTNVEGAEGGGIIQAKLGAVDMYAVFAVIRKAISDPEFTTKKIPCYTGPLDQQVLESTVVVGRDSEKCLFIAVSSADDKQPKIKFRFLPSTYHRLLDSTGKQESTKDISEYWATGWVTLIENLAAAVLAKDGADRSQNENSSAFAGNRTEAQGQAKQWNNNGGNGGFQKKSWDGQKKPWDGQKKQWNGGQGGGGFQKKPWDGQKKPWNNNSNGGNGGYQKKSWGDQNKQSSYKPAPAEESYSGDFGGSDSDTGFDDDIPF